MSWPAGLAESDASTATLGGIALLNQRSRMLLELGFVSTRGGIILLPTLDAKENRFWYKFVCGPAAAAAQMWSLIEARGGRFPCEEPGYFCETGDQSAADAVKAGTFVLTTNYPILARLQTNMSQIVELSTMIDPRRAKGVMKEGLS